ncbi:MAG: C2 domain-containing protein, partial [archaeon]|nr:C2 domain-containing protein [archaeon]
MLCVRVKLLAGAKLAVKDIRTSDPYAKVWSGPKGMIEPPERGLYISTCQESTLNPTWGEGRKISKMTKDMYKKFKDLMIPLSEPKQDEWTFLWKEGQAIHVQLWDRDSGSEDDYMGNVSFALDINKKGPQRVTENVHNGPPGQMRSKEKVSGTITIEWEWATKTDQLNIEQWISVLQKLTYGDDRALSFLRQEDLIPHMSVAAARFILGQISKGKVNLPQADISFKADSSMKHHPSKMQDAPNQTDWEKELLDDDDDDSDDDDAREPDGIVFLNL